MQFHCFFATALIKSDLRRQKANLDNGLKTVSVTHICMRHAIGGRIFILWKSRYSCFLRSKI